MDTGSPQRLTLEEMSNTARRILTENPEITQRMFEHLQTQLGPDQLPGSPKPVEEGPNTTNRGSPSVRLNQLTFGQSPRGRFLLTPRQGMGFTLGIRQETSTFRLNVEGMSFEQPSPVVEQLATVEEEPVPQEEPTVVPREELEEEDGQADPVTPHPEGAKTRPMTRSATKQGPSKKAPASSKWPTKTPRKGSTSKKPQK